MLDATVSLARIAAVFLAACVSVGSGELQNQACPTGSRLMSGLPEDQELAESLGVTHAQWCERDGVREGPYRDFYPSGQVFQQIEFRKGKRHGRMVTFYANGTVWEEVHYREGRLSGRATSWNEAGRVVEIAEYEVRGRDVHGRFQSWYPDGRKLAEGETLNEELHGRLVFYDEQGHRTVEVYDKGHRVQRPEGERQP